MNKLPRELGFTSSFFAVLGSVIGSAVFLVASDITKSLPSPGLALSVWIVAGAVSLLGGLIFAELGAMFPEAGGQYVYFRKAFGPVPAFLFGWTHCLILLPGTLAALAVAFAQFATAFVPLAPSGVRVVASISMLALTLLNYWGVKRGAVVLNWLTFLKTGAILGLSAAGLSLLFTGGATGSAATGVGAAPAAITVGAYGVALIAAFWAFDGWNGLSQVAGEIRDPSKNIPRATVAGILAATLIYLLINGAYYLGLSLPAIAASTNVAADLARAVFSGGGLAGFAAQAVAATILFSTLGCLNAAVMTGSRVMFAAADEGDLPEVLARIHPRFHTPSSSLVFQLATALVLIWSGTYDQLFTYVVFAGFLFYALTAVALLVLRWRIPNVSRPYRLPASPLLPLVYILFCVFFLINSVMEKPWESLIGVVIMGAGVPAFYLLRRKKPEVLDFRTA